jgi:hypothetical protein
MTKRTLDHARPQRPTATTTATRHGYLGNTTKPSFARDNPYITARNPCHCTVTNPILYISVCLRPRRDQVQAPRHVTLYKTHSFTASWKK